MLQQGGVRPLPAIELEHTIGYNAKFGNCVAGKGGRYFYAAGGSVVGTDAADIHSEQLFLRATEEAVGLLCLSSSGRWLVAAQTAGANPDVVLWDMETKALAFRITEHEGGVSAVSMTADEYLLLTVGVDRRVIVWDVATGQIVSITSLPATSDNPEVTSCAWGGLIENVKRQKTGVYQFAVTVSDSILRYSLDPSDPVAQVKLARTNMGNVVRHWTCCCYSADGDLLFVGSTTGDLVVIPTADGTSSKTISVCQSGIRFLTTSPPPQQQQQQQQQQHQPPQQAPGSFQYARFGENSRRSTTLFVGGHAGEVLKCAVADHAQPQEIRVAARATVSGPVNSLACFAAAGGGLLAGTATGDVFALSDQLEPRRLSAAPQGGVTCLAPHPYQGDRFATGSADGSFRIWDLSTYLEVCKSGIVTGAGRRARGSAAKQGSGAFVSAGAPAAPAHPTALEYVGQTDTAITGWSDGAFRCFDTVHDELHWETRDRHRGAVTGIVIPSTLRFFVTSDSTGEVKMWDMKNRVLAREFKQHQSAITGLEMFADGAHVMSASRDRSVLSWNVETGQRVATNMLPNGQIHSLFLCANQQNFITVGSDKRVSLWDTRQHEPCRQVAVCESQTADVTPHAVAGSPCGRYFAVGGTDQAVTLWDFAAFCPVQVAAGHSGTVSRIRFSPDNKQILSCAADACVNVWNFYTWLSIHSLFLCANQQNFITVGSDKRVSLWDTRQHEPCRQVAVCESQTADVTPHAVAGSPCGRYFAVGGTDQAVALWDFAAFCPVQVAAGHSGTVSRIRFSPDNKQILSCAADACVNVWNFYT
ncbi:Cilia- and flagella-associated protein 52 [Diplonema papillatum]|nr:Cilia- and flagella-associated protein 52 [Diplonema papillatum]